MVLEMTMMATVVIPITTVITTIPVPVFAVQIIEMETAEGLFVALPLCLAGDNQSW